MTICKECGEECDVIEIADSVGVTEYFGAVARDWRTALVSECCDANFDEVDEDEKPTNKGE